MPETATIRVERDVRDQLARAARQRGVSLAGLLKRYAREQAIESERLASMHDERRPDAIAEQEDWDSTLGDGID